LALPDEMTIDPLYEIKNGWKIVYSPEELENYCLHIAKEKLPIQKIMS